MTQMLSDSFSINAQGHLAVGGADTLELAAKYGTPLYVMDENGIRRTCRRYRESIARFYGGNGLALYASKTFCCKEIYRIVAEEGFGADVVSGGELYTALQAGFPTEKIYFHGNNKTPEELRYAAENGIGAIVVDNLAELQSLCRLLEGLDKHQDILLRIKPGVDAHTHDFIRTGQIDSKFGFALETGEALAAVKSALAASRVRLKGLHCHIGSQIFDTEPFCHAARVMVGFMGDIKRETGYVAERLNLGGGFGIQYLAGDDPSPYESYMQQVSAAVHAACAEEGLPIPQILIEPGRSVVGDAGATLYTIGSIKEIPGVRTYLSVDGGMTDNPRYALYGAKYEALVCARAGEPRTKTVTIAGKCCESGDLLAEGAPVQECAPGDILAMLCTGAYNYAMASNYNRIPRPPVVFVRDGVARLAVRRESYADLIRNDL